LITMPGTTNTTATDAASVTPAVFMSSVDLTLLTMVQRGFVLSIRGLEVDAERVPLTGEQVKESVAQEFPPAVLFGADLTALPLAHRELRRWLDSHGAALGTHPSHRIAPLLAASLYSDPEDTVAAKEIVRAQLAAGRRTNALGTADPASEEPVRGSGRGTGGTSSQDRLAHNVGMRFRDPSAKFSGGIGESWMEYVGDYQQVARDYNLTATQKLQFLHNIVVGAAKRYYINHVQAFATTFAQAVEMVGNEFNSAVQQNEVKTYLSTYDMNALVEGGKTEAGALAHTYKTIVKLAPLLPRCHQGDANSVDFLHHAVLGYEWATEPLSRVATHDLSFQQLYGELAASLQLHSAAKRAKDRRSSIADGQVKSELASVMFAGQGVYGRPKTGVGATSAAGASRAVQRKDRFDPLSLMGCFNCDDPGHTMRDCPRPRDATRAAKRKLDYFAKKRAGTPALAGILFQLCQ